MIKPNDATQEPMTPESLVRFDVASEHPYECNCELCKEWWVLMGEEE